MGYKKPLGQPIRGPLQKSMNMKKPMPTLEERAGRKSLLTERNY